MTELNPAFDFDFGGSDEGDVQAPWELGGALAQTEQDAGGTAATSIDYKISQLLERTKPPVAWEKKKAAIAAAANGKGAGRGKQGAGRGRPGAAAAAAASDSDGEGSGSDGGGMSDSDEDAPLPGEVDEGDSDDGDMSLGGGEEEEEEEEEDEEGSEDEIARAVMDMDSDQLDMSSDEEQEEEEEEEEEVLAPVPPPKRKRIEQQQAAAEQEQQAQQKPRRGAAGAADGQQQQQQQQQEGKQAKQAKDAAGKQRKGAFYDATPTDTSYSAKSFADLGLSRPLAKACQVLGYTNPTPIQAACIPLAMAGRDICGSAVTGSGKTAAFGLPILERLLFRDKRVAATYVLVLTPVRELAVQVHSMITKLAQFTDIQAALVVGGLSLQAQATVLRTNPEIVVATPGRMIDHLRNTQSVGLEDLTVLVLDEADRLLEMGFAEEIREVVKQTPSQRQTMLFSATMTEEVKRLADLSLRQPVRLAADAAATAPKELTQEIVRLKGGQAAQKEAALLALCSRTFKGGRTIVFAKTKQRAHRLKILFGLAGLPASCELHGDMTQAARLESLERFRKGEVGFLLATELAARGLDILGVEAVVNYDCPAHLTSYLHRVGRTARAGAKGRALSFIEDDDRGLLKEVIKRTGVQMQQRQLPQVAIDSWQRKLEELEWQVGAIMQEEREERALRKAEMEAQRASNLLEHEAEIYARPPRTWFQTEKEKKEVAQKAKEAAAKRGTGGGGGGDEGSDDEGEGDQAQQAKRGAKNKSDKRLEQKQQRAKEAADKAKKKGNKLMDETAAASRSIRAVKAKEQELRLEGLTSGRAGKIAASLVTGVKRKKKKGKQGKERELFDGDGLPDKPGSGPSKVYSGGASSGKVKAPRSGKGLGKSELNKVKRGGKGKHGFKSKAKHKRR